MLRNSSQKRYSRLVARTSSLPCISSLETGWKGFVTDAGIRIDTLLKNDNISFLIGAGASKEAPESSCAEVLLPGRPSVAMWRTLVHAGYSENPRLSGPIWGFAQLRA